jgi:hypothetical protein
MISMALFIPVQESQVRFCQLCNERITFVERQGTGFWIPTDVIQDTDSGAWGYRTKLLESTQEATAILHRCWGDPDVSTTKNGRKIAYLEKLKSLEQRIKSVTLRSKISSPEMDEVQAVRSSPEYLELQREHNELVREYADLLGRS